MDGAGSLPTPVRQWLRRDARTPISLGGIKVQSPESAKLTIEPQDAGPGDAET